MIDCTDLVGAFAAEVSGLGGKRGPLLVQLPPGLDFARESAAVFFELLRTVAGGEIACEPRHPGWFGAPATDLLASAGVARVMADPLPARIAQAEPVAARTLLPGGGLRYVRLHGTPQIYRSPYSDAALATWRDRVVATASDESCWTIFDNTAGGAAVGDAHRFARLVQAAGR